MSKETVQKFTKIAIFAIAMGVIINLTTGLQNVWSVLGRQLTQDYGWSVVEATRPYSILTVASGLWSVVAGRWGDKHGHKWPMYFGAVMMGGGLILSSLHQNAILMCITAGLMLGFSSSSITCNTAGNSIQWSPIRYKGLVSGLTTAGFALSSMYMAPVIAAMLGAFGLVNTFRFAGIAAIIVICILVTFLPDSKSKKYKEEAMRISGNNGEEAAAATNQVDYSKYKNTVSPNKALTKWEFWAAWLMYLLGNMGGQVFISQAVTIAGVQAPEWTNPVILVTLLAFANFIGRFAVPALSDKIGVFTITKITMLIQGINWILFSHYHSPISLIVGCLVLGFTFGSNIPMLWNWLSTAFGTKEISAMQGMGTTAWAVGGLVGPLFAAYLMDTTGGYGMTFTIMGVLCFVCVAICFTLKNRYDDSAVQTEQ